MRDQSGLGIDFNIEIILIPECRGARLIQAVTFKRNMLRLNRTEPECDLNTGTRMNQN
jgi:hypothetical protein